MYVRFFTSLKVVIKWTSDIIRELEIWTGDFVHVCIYTPISHVSILRPGHLTAKSELIITQWFSEFKYDIDVIFKFDLHDKCNMEVCITFYRYTLQILCIRRPLTLLSFHCLLYLYLSYVADPVLYMHCLPWSKPLEQQKRLFKCPTMMVSVCARVPVCVCACLPPTRPHCCHSL